jgi:hypothetical protein
MSAFWALPPTRYPAGIAPSGLGIEAADFGDAEGAPRRQRGRRRRKPERGSSIVDRARAMVSCLAVVGEASASLPGMVRRPGRQQAPDPGAANSAQTVLPGPWAWAGR